MYGTLPGTIMGPPKQRQKLVSNDNGETRLKRQRNDGKRERRNAKSLLNDRNLRD